jgi:ASC-1-like (ASCH) protein
MKIIQKTSDRLIIQDTPIRDFMISFLFVGLMPLIAIFESLPRQQTLNCQRIEPTQVNCRVEKDVIGIKSEEITFTQVTGAEVIEEVIEQEESTDENTYKFYQIKLYTKTQSSDFGETTRDEAETRAISKQINTFLANPQQQVFQITKVDQSLTETRDAIFVSLFFATFWYGFVGLFLFILGILFSASWVKNWNFDKTQHQLRVTQWFLIKRKTKEHSLLGQVSLKIDDSQKDSEDDTLYELNLILNSGEKIIWNFGTNKTKAEKLRNEIGQFLDLQVEQL